MTEKGFLRGQPGYPVAGRGVKEPTAASPSPAPSLSSRSLQGTRSLGSGIRVLEKPRPWLPPWCHEGNVSAEGVTLAETTGSVQMLFGFDPSLHLQLGWTELQGSEVNPALWDLGTLIFQLVPARASSARGGRDEGKPQLREFPH